MPPSRAPGIGLLLPLSEGSSRAIQRADQGRPTDTGSEGVHRATDPASGTTVDPAQRQRAGARDPARATRYGSRMVRAGSKDVGTGGREKFGSATKTGRREPSREKPRPGGFLRMSTYPERSRRCLTPRCGGTAPAGRSRCQKCSGGNWTRPSKADPKAYRGDWPRLRTLVLERDRYRCQVGGPGCDCHGVEADHIRSVAEGGTNALENLRAICVPCHRRRTGQQGAAAAKKSRERRNR